MKKIYFFTLVLKVLSKFSFRERFMHWLYSWSQQACTNNFKQHKSAWPIQIQDLVQMPTNTVGFRLGQFIQQQKFELMPKLERHDVYHIITGLGTSLPEEIAMQYLLLGNGKRSLYQFAMIGIGTCLYPEKWQLYIRNYEAGKEFQPFHNIDFYPLLTTDFNTFKNQLTNSL